jgi:hypothetical protein
VTCASGPGTAVRAAGASVFGAATRSFAHDTARIRRAVGIRAVVDAVVDVRPGAIPAAGAASVLRAWTLSSALDAGALVRAVAAVLEATTASVRTGRADPAAAAVNAVVPGCTVALIVHCAVVHAGPGGRVATTDTRAAVAAIEVPGAVLRAVLRAGPRRTSRSGPSFRRTDAAAGRTSVTRCVPALLVLASAGAVAAAGVPAFLRPASAGSIARSVPGFV